MTRRRKSCYTAELARVICERLVAGEYLHKICRDPGMPAESTVRAWVVDDHASFAAQYARARDIGLDCMSGRLLEVAGDKQRDPNWRRVEVMR